MQKEERCFRRLLSETLVSGPEQLTGSEIRGALGIGGKMITAAKKSIREKNAENENQDPRCPRKSRIISHALERRRKTTKFDEKRKLIRQFFEEKSMPTSRRRDVVRTKVTMRLITESLHNLGKY